MKIYLKNGHQAVSFEVFDDEHLLQDRHLVPWHRQGGLIVDVCAIQMIRQVFEGG